MASQRRQAVDQRIIILLLIGGLILIRHLPRHAAISIQAPSPVFWLSTTTGGGNFYEAGIIKNGWGIIYGLFGMNQPDLFNISWPPPDLSSYQIDSSKLPRQIAVPAEVAPFVFLPIPINTASCKLLTIIPGVGNTLATEIIRYRQKYGPIRLADLGKIPGIGPQKKEIIAKRVSF